MIFKQFNAENADQAREFMDPGYVDQTVRQAIWMCWLGTPPARKSVDEVEREFRRLLDRALRELRDDATAFDQ